MERPKLGEDEDDLLKIQRDFLSSKATPAATAVRKGDKRKSGEPTRDVVHMDSEFCKTVNEVFFLFFFRVT